MTMHRIDHRPSGRRSKPRLLLGLGTLLLALSSVPGAARAEDGEAPGLDAERVTWRTLRFHAAKLFLSANAEVRLELLGTEQAVPALAVAPDGLGRLPRGARVVRLTVESALAGKKTVEDVWLDAIDGAVLERRKVRRGGKPYVRNERFTPAGVHRERRAPANDREAGKPADRWSDRQTDFQAFPDGGSLPPVTHALALFYLVSAAPLEAPGDRFETTIFSHGRLIPITLEVTGMETITVAFDELRSEGTEARTGSVHALRIRISDGGAEGTDVRLLGLKRDIEILVEPSTRLPLIVRGSVGFVGRVNVRLTQADWR